MPIMRPTNRSTQLILLALTTTFLFYLYLSATSSASRSPSTSLPHRIPLFKSHRPHHPFPSAELGQKKRLAIIGAGASGSSAAFFARRAAREAGVIEEQLEIVVFEKEDYVGGRSTTVYPYDNPSLVPVELGASIFVDANLNMQRAMHHFSLPYSPSTDSDIPSLPPPGIALYDGTSFLFSSPSTFSSWPDKARLLLRYGFSSPSRTQNAVRQLVDKIGRVYEAGFVRRGGGRGGGWGSVEELSQDLGFEELTERTTRDWFVEKVGTSAKWVEEMVEAATRVNYGQDVSDLHALVGSVSLAATGASSVQGGNWRIFGSFLAEAEAKLHLATRVTQITSLHIKPTTNTSSSTAQFLLTSNDTSLNHSPALQEPFDAIFLASPFHQANISLGGEQLEGFGDAIPEQPYIHLHTTLLTTTSPHPLPSFFRQSSNTYIPRQILTTSRTHRASPSSHPLPDFQSITYHGETTLESGEYVVKVFSLERRSDEWLKKVFGDGQGAVGWVHRKVWSSYPHLPPTTTFPPILPIPSLPIFYLASMESFISTMETQTISGRNAVALLVNDWWGVRPGSCGRETLLGREGGWDWTCWEEGEGLSEGWGERRRRRR